MEIMMAVVVPEVIVHTMVEALPLAIVMESIAYGQAKRRLVVRMRADAGRGKGSYA